MSDSQPNKPLSEMSAREVSNFVSNNSLTAEELKAVNDRLRALKAGYFYTFISEVGGDVIGIQG